MTMATVTMIYMLKLISVTFLLSAALAKNSTTAFPETTPQSPTECGEPNNTTGTSVTTTPDTQFGANATYSCLPGYEMLTSAATLTCQADGTWSGTAPSCSKKDCEEPNKTMGTSVITTPDTQFGANATYSCLPGYETLTSAATLTCQADGTWSGTAPSCSKKDCEEPNKTTGTSVITTPDTQFGANATYSCLPGYETLTSAATLTCQADGTWSGTAPSCSKKDCEEPNKTTGTSVITTPDTQFGANATYSCLPGYETLTSAATLTCQADGTWSGTAPSCSKKDCEEPNKTTGTSVITTPDTQFGANATYSCLPGYETLTSAATLTCQADGTWSGTAPSCSKKDCGEPSKTTGTSVITTPDTQFGANATYSCLAGYEMLTSAATLTCQADGTWSGTAPSCSKKDCGNLPHPENGLSMIDDVTDTTVGATATVGCYEGYTSEGNITTLVCLITGSWSSVPKCNVVDCSNPGNITNGDHQLNGLNVNSTVTYTCKDGYELFGDSILTCTQVMKTSEGIWFGQTPNCSLQRISFEDVCAVTTPNPCTTENATCKECEDDSMRCLCEHLDNFFKNSTDACVVKLDLNLNNLDMRIQEIQENLLHLHWYNVPTLRHEYDYIRFEVTPRPGDSDGSFIVHNKVPAVDYNVYLPIEHLNAGHLYNISYNVFKDDIPNRTPLFVQSYTRPGVVQVMSLLNITTTSFVLSWDDEGLSFADYIVRIEPTPGSFNSICDVQGNNCSFSKELNLTDLEIHDLTTGQQYTVSMYTFIGGLLSLPSNNKSTYTVPVVPNLTKQEVTSSSFAVFYTDKKGGFSNWSVTVTDKDNNTVSNTADSGEPLKIQHLQSGTLYTLAVTTHVPGFNSEEKKEYWYTRPSTPESVDIPTNRVHETSFSVTFSVPDFRFDQVFVSACSSNSSSSCSTKSVDAVHHPSTSFEVLINDLKPATLYTVVVFTNLTNNTILSSDSSMKRTSYSGPLPPIAKIGSVEFKELVLNVEGNNQSRFDTYSVEYNQALISGNHGDGDIIINQLTPGTFYNFSIYTVLDGIKSDRFNSVSSYTRPDNVTSIGISHVSSSLMNVTWNRPAEGTVHTFVVVFSCISPNTVSTINETQNYTVTQEMAAATNLDPGTFCNTTITTHVGDQTGTPVFEKLLTSTEEQAPGNVTSFDIVGITSKSATVRWDAPTLRNGLIRTYHSKIILQETGQCVASFLQTCSSCTTQQLPSLEGYCNVTDTVSFDEAADDFRWPIPNLHPYRNYSVEVVAFTLPSLQGTTVTQIQQTLEDIPGVPYDFTVNDYTFDYIDLTWDKPKERNGEIMNYTILYTFYERQCNTPSSTGNSSTRVTMNPALTLNESIFPYWDYNITVVATNKIGTGNPTDVKHVKTNETYPEQVTNVSYRGLTDNNVTLMWNRPCHENGVLLKYNLTITNDSAEFHMSEPWMKQLDISHTLNEEDIYFLLPYRNYTLTLNAVNSVGASGNYDTKIMASISEPTEPSDVHATALSSSSILTRWEKATVITGPTKYHVSVKDAVDTHLHIPECITATSYWFDNLAHNCTITGLDAYWWYNFTVTALTGSFTSESISFSQQTREDKPGNVTKLNVSSETNVTKPRTIFVHWNKPSIRDVNGQITSYTVTYTRSNSNLTIKKITAELSDEIEVNETGTYDVQVAASTSVGLGSLVSATVTIGPGAPIKVDESVSGLLIKIATSASVDDDKTQIAVSLPLHEFLCDDRNGKPLSWGVIVSQSDQANDAPFQGTKERFEQKRKNKYKNWFAVEDLDDFTPYIATPTDWNPCQNAKRRKRSASSDLPVSKDFKIGVDGDCSGIASTSNCNGALKPGKSYRVKSYVCTDGGCTETLYSAPISTEPDYTIPIVAGVSSAVGVLIIVIVIIFLKRRNAACFAKDDENFSTPTHRHTMEHEMQAKKPHGFRPGPVKLTDFPGYVDRMHKDSDLLFADAYKMIRENSPAHPVTVAESQTCRSRNRYTNILPFDHSRVKLRPLDDVEGSDFINANYIPGYTSKREYIATQGPMIATFDDFWRMIWEQNVDTIVMLTKLVEKGRIKCDKYWPDATDPVFYGDLVVSVQSESNLSDYTLRIFELKMKDERRMVRQFAYLKWPDMGCPDDPSMLLAFVKTVKEHRKPERQPSAGPMVVHCSAGVGRTGTFIAVDNLLQHIRDHDDVDIYNLVLDMRKQRCNMVQTEDQFVYIHECLKAFITTDEEDDDNYGDEPLYENTKQEDNVYENTAFSGDS